MAEETAAPMDESTEEAPELREKLAKWSCERAAMFKSLFDPSKVQEKKTAQELKRDACARIKAWAEARLPDAAKGVLRVTVDEVQCGDPSCAPIDTAIEFWGPDVRSGFGIARFPGGDPASEMARSGRGPEHPGDALANF